MRTIFPARNPREAGVATLPISLILLVLLTLITLYAARVGLLETRTSANKQRAEEAFSASEAVVEQAMQFLNLNRSIVLSTTAPGWLDTTNSGSNREWVTCPASDPELPCSSAADRTSWLVVKNLPTTTLTACTDIDSNDTGPVDNIPNGKCDNNSANFSNAAGSSLYVHAMTRCKDSNNDGTCDAATPNDYPVITLVGGGTSADGTALAQVMQSVHFYDAFPGSSTSFAPLVAAGTVTGSGTFDIVGNPDIGANDSNSISSNKLAVWSGSDVVVGSSSGTCREGNPSITGFLTGLSAANLAGADVYNSVQAYHDHYASNPNGAHPQADIINGYFPNGEPLYLCKSCTCPHTLTGTNGSPNGAISVSPGALTSTVEDDILDIESSGAVGKWQNTTFPDDVFRLFTGTPTSQWQSYKNSLLPDHILSSCDGLNTTSSGIYWVAGNCVRTASKGDIGSPLYRSTLKIIVQGDLDLRANIYVWGAMLVFQAPGDPARDISLNGSPTFYGSLLANTSITFSGGNYKSRYLPEPNGTTVPPDKKWGFARLPGSWRDY